MPPVRILFGVLSALALVAVLVGTKQGWIVPLDELVPWVNANQLRAVLILVGTFVGILSIVAEFPGSVVREGSTVNFVAHGIGTG
ncbi:hypothetical protein [Haloprofundus salinisoli]|uniref:hypothetical protein n=1 Tax=Haloprofundus salinisoli TaxID=2876193 RepID=UPI001CCFD2B2|nr:hypothetical protein [Haloprofundus salinisoli]